MCDARAARGRRSGAFSGYQLAEGVSLAASASRFSTSWAPIAPGTRVPGAIGAQEVEKRLAEAASDTTTAN